MTTTDTFYQASGASPPSESQAADAGAPLPDSPPLPPELIEDLVRLLADALIADIRQYPNLAEVNAKRESTVESPSGHDRNGACTAPAPGIEGPAISDQQARAGVIATPPPGLEEPPPKKTRGSDAPGMVVRDREGNSGVR